MTSVANKRRRFGYRRIGVMLERKGMIMNHKTLFRLYRSEGMSVKRRRGRTRAKGARTPMPEVLKPGERVALLRALPPPRLPKPTTTNMKTRPAKPRYE